MRWEWQSDLSWLNARRKYLTASDFVKLKSSLSKASKSALAGEKILPAFAAVWMEKNSPSVEIDESDFLVYGAAARGHALEQSAVDCYNAAFGKEKKVYHWDDCILTNGKAGFSPDALDQIQLFRPELKADKVKPTHAVELKCYGVENHAKAVVTSPRALPERFQLAWAMYVCPSIETGDVVFYHPDAAVRMKVFTYTRDDLHDELELAKQVMDVYGKTDSLMKEFVDTPINEAVKDATRSESDIWRSLYG